MKIHVFVRMNKINTGDKIEVINLMEKFITEFTIDAKTFKDEDGFGIVVNTIKAENDLEIFLYWLEEKEVRLEDFFSGRLFRNF